MPFGGLLTASAIGAGGGILGGLLGKSAAEKAANIQAQAAKYAADKAGQSQGDILTYDNAVRQQQLEQAAPWLHTGTGAILSLNDMIQNPNSDLRKQFDPQQFAEGFQGDPGYAFRLSEGQKALERSAAAKGTSLGTAGVKGAIRFGQDYGSNEYDRAYSRAQGTLNTNNTNQFNRLAALAGVGQQTQQQLGQEGAQSASQVGNTIMGTTAEQNNLLTSGAAARASGYVGGTNALTAGFGGAANSAQNLALYRILFGGGGAFGAPKAGNIPGGVTAGTPSGGPLDWLGDPGQIPSQDLSGANDYLRNAGMVP